MILAEAPGCDEVIIHVGFRDNKESFSLLFGVKIIHTDIYHRISGIDSKLNEET